MAESSTVTALRAKRDELERIISSYEKAIEAARRDLAHVNATLQPSKMSIIRVFRRDEIFQICKVALAQAPTGIDSRELALVVLRMVLRKAVAYSIINVMRAQNRRGMSRTLE